MGTPKKIGVTACTGIDMPDGTVARMALYKVLDELRKEETVLICLPALAAEVEEDVEFVRDYPVLLLDGCSKNCALNVFNDFKSNIVRKFNVEEYRKRFPHLKPGSVLDMGKDGEELANIIAADIAKAVDEVIENA